MPPNLRSAVAQCWRSIGSRRNFSSSSGSNESKGAGETVVVLTHRGLALSLGYFGGAITIGNPARKFAKELEEDVREFEETWGKDDLVSARKF